MLTSEEFKQIQILNKKEYSKNYHKTHHYKHPKHYQRDYSRKKREEFNRKMEMLVGNACIICGSHEKLTFHEINGKSHYYEYAKNIKLYYKDILANWKNFIPLCRKHHLLCHHLAESLHSDTELTKAVEIIKKLLL